MQVTSETCTSKPSVFVDIFSSGRIKKDGEMDASYPNEHTDQQNTHVEGAVPVTSGRRLLANLRPA